MAWPSWQTVEPEIAQELTCILGLSDPFALEQLQAKDGIYVCRASQAECAVIAKFFAAVPARREIRNYQLLISLGVPTLTVLGYSQRCLCLEDLSRSERCGLGTPRDLKDPAIAHLIALWYRELHDRGRNAAPGSLLYAETDLLTPEALRVLEMRYPEGRATWLYLDRHLGDLQNHLASLDQTITYNDFYWTNLAVSRRRDSALMFDYNLLGRGYRYGDVRNVCSSLSPAASAAFLQTYGPIDEQEAAVDAVVAPLVGLISAAARPDFPSWAEDALHSACDSRLIHAVQRLL